MIIGSLLRIILGCRKENIDLERGKEVLDENMAKCFKQPMSNEKVHMCLNTTRNAWYVVFQL